MESTPIIKLAPGFKSKLLALMIPVIVVIGVTMLISDYFTVGSEARQSPEKTALLLGLYSFFSVRGLIRYRIFFDLYPDKIIWRQGFSPLSSLYEIQFDDIESMSITPFTGTLIFHMNPEKFPRELRLTSAFRIAEGKLVMPDVENLEREIGHPNPAVRDLYYLKYEIEKRKSAIKKTVY
jgi:hypothetical protein